MRDKQKEIEKELFEQLKYTMDKFVPLFTLVLGLSGLFFSIVSFILNKSSLFFNSTSSTINQTAFRSFVLISTSGSSGFIISNIGFSFVFLILAFIIIIVCNYILIKTIY